MPNNQFFESRKKLNKSNLDQETVYNYLEKSAALYPEKPAIIFYDSVVSYAQLKRQVDCVAGFLQIEFGLKKNTPVMLFLQNSPQFIIAYYAIIRAEGIIVPINPMNKSDELRYYVEDSGSQSLFCAQDLIPRTESLLEDGTLKNIIAVTYSDYLFKPTDIKLSTEVTDDRHSYCNSNIYNWRDIFQFNYRPNKFRANSQDICMVPYTSGTTGRPKGCLIDHGNLNHTTVTPAHWISINCDSVVLSALPLFHAAGMQGSMNQPIYAGATIVLMTRWQPNSAAILIERYKVSYWTCVPTMALDFFCNPDLLRFQVESLVRIGGGGAAMPEATAEKILQFTGLEYREAYGLSETIGATHMNPQARPKRNSIGVPINDTESLIIDPLTLRQMKTNEEGEIVVRGPQVFKGYKDNNSATSEAFVEIENHYFFRTGDVGYRDEEGYFFVVDRLKRMINVSGLKVWPAEIENSLRGHPQVNEACVVGARDRRKGEIVKALIVLKKSISDEITCEEIITWARSRLSPYKVPVIMDFVDYLPKTATGKIMWRKLQEEEDRKTINL